MTNTGWTRRLQQAARIGLLGISVLGVSLAFVCASGPARAEDDDNSIWTLNERVMKNFMGALGLQNGSESGIDYRERSPLVVPPSSNLPAPESTSAPTNPAWPVDPDQKRARESSRRARNFITGTNEDSRPLRPNELDTAATEAARRRGGGKSNPSSGTDRQLLPSELGYGGGLFSLKSLGFGSQADEVGTFKQEPPRASLSEPPSGYQVPSPAQPYGVTKRTERKVTPYDASVGTVGR